MAMDLRSSLMYVDFCNCLQMTGTIGTRADGCSLAHGHHPSRCPCHFQHRSLRIMFGSQSNLLLYRDKYQQQLLIQSSRLIFASDLLNRVAHLITF